MKQDDTLVRMLARRKFEDVELLAYAEWLGFNNELELENLEGAKLRKQVAKEILANPQQVLSRLPLEDLQLLQILKDAEPGMGMKAYSTSHTMAMAEIGLAEQEDIEDGEMEMITIAEDFKQAIRPHVDAVLENIDVKFRIYIEQIIIGALNLYGTLTESELKSILKECMDLTDDGSGVLEHIRPQSILLHLISVDGSYDDGEDYYVSPFEQNLGEYILAEREKQSETTTLKTYDVDEIREAGNMPIPTIPNPVSNKLLNTLETKLGFTEQEAYYWEFMLWRLAQDDDASPIGILQLLIDASPSCKKLKDINDIEPIVQVVMDYLNHSPRWIFYGHCPNDLGSTEQMIECDDFDAFIPYVTASTAEPNDPCPCGSGKKFKDCCGRGN